MSYNTVLEAHLGLGRFDEARSSLKEMPSRILPDNQVTYNEFLRALTASKDHRAVWSPVGPEVAQTLTALGACSLWDDWRCRVIWF